MRALIWFRSDLRVVDQPALAAATAAADEGVIGLFVLTPRQWLRHDWGPARVAFLLGCLAELRERLAELHIPLLIRQVTDFSRVPAMVAKVMDEHGCRVCYANSEFEVNEQARDGQVAERLAQRGRELRLSQDQCLVPPGRLTTGAGKPYRVFTPFKKAWLAHCQDRGLPERAWRARKQSTLDLASDDIPVRVRGFAAEPSALRYWQPGSAAGEHLLQRFCRDRIRSYEQERDRPDLDATSGLSPYLAIGAISIGQCFRAAIAANDGEMVGGDGGVQTWISELIWREFYRHILVAFPRVGRHRAFQSATEGLRWRDDPAQETAWQEGRTGIPIVDAAMRQLHETGWMHNRLRMVVAMFFSKNLFLDWRRGERHFMQQLVDGDLASNNGGWQWSASTGTDAAPYFRVFNPYSQSERFDPDGSFIRNWVPELADLQGKDLHDPGRLSAEERRRRDYPDAIVDCKASRKRAIAAFQRVIK